MSHGAKSQDDYHAITPFCVDICPPIISLEKKQSQRKKIQLKSFTFSSLLFYMEEKQTRFVKSSDSDTKKQFANAVPERTKSTKSTKYTVNVLEGDVKLRVLFHMSIYTTFSTCTIT